MDHAQPKRKSRKNKVATGYENSIATKRTLGKKSGRMESRPPKNQDMQSSRKTNKEMGRCNSNDFLKPEETEATKGSDIKKQRHIWVAKQKNKWKEKEDEFAAASKKKKVDFT